MPSLKAISDALDAVLKREDWPTYSNRAADRGGPTKGGITLDTLRMFRGRPTTVEDLQNLTEGEARVIYRSRYLRPWEFIAYDPLFDAVVDYAVTSGHDDPTKALQIKVGVVVDGKLGPMTRAAVSKADPKMLRDYLIGYRVRHMVDLALNDPKLKALIKGHYDLQIRNLRGWLNRTTSFLG